MARFKFTKITTWLKIFLSMHDHYHENYQQISKPSAIIIAYGQFPFGLTTTYK